MNNILGAYLTPHPPIIIEEIGRGEEKKAEDTIAAMKKISKDIKEKAPETIVLISPHGPVFSDAIALSSQEDLYGSFEKFGMGKLKYKFKNNLELVEKILAETSKENIVTVKIDKDTASMYNVDLDLDHGALVPLDFIEDEYKDFSLVHITYGILPPKDLYKFGQIVKKAIKDLDEKAIIIASGDLSHKLSNDGPYNYSPFGKVFDEKIMGIIKDEKLKDLITFDLKLSEQAGECGLRSLMIMAGTLDGLDIHTKVLSYQGPFGVGYGTAIIDVIGENSRDILKEIIREEELKIDKSRKDESDYVKLARESLETFIKTGKKLEVEEETDIKRGVFVTLKKDGILRGCIGTTQATTDSIEREIVQNAISAGSKDPRFPRVKEDELKDLVYSVDLLFSPEPIDNMEDLDVEKYGLIVTSGYKRGLLLPNLEGVDTVREQVDITLEKAGISPNETYKMERFKVERYY